MSFDYRGCFILRKDSIDPVGLQTTLASFDLVFVGAFSTLEYEAGLVHEKAALARDWTAFIADSNGPTPSAYGRLAMRQSAWLREIDVNGVQVLTRYLSGLDEYFPKSGT